MPSDCLKFGKCEQVLSLPAQLRPVNQGQKRLATQTWVHWLCCHAQPVPKITGDKWQELAKYDSGWFLSDIHLLILLEIWWARQGLNL
jgi:hypothetical protein